MSDKLEVESICTMKARIAIVDDHPVFRRGLIAVLQEAGKNLEVTIEAKNGEALLKALDSSRNLPQICILDLYMPGMDGYATLRALKERFPSIKVLIYSFYKHDFSISYTIGLGAVGYVNKEDPPEKLLEAIDSILQYGLYNSEVMMRSLQKVFYQASHPEKILQAREIEFIKLSCADHTDEEIAARMHLSPRTMGGYRDRIYEKLQVHNKAGLVKFAMATGLFMGD